MKIMENEENSKNSVVCTECGASREMPTHSYGETDQVCWPCKNKIQHKRRISRATDISNDPSRLQEIPMFYSEELDKYTDDPEDYMYDRFDMYYDDEIDEYSERAEPSYDENPERFIWWACVPGGPKLMSAVDHLDNFIENLSEEYPEEMCGDVVYSLPKDDENIICDLLQKWLDSLPNLYYPAYKEYMAIELSSIVEHSADES